ncbi:MAG: hypothetical protein H7844_05860 [Nitrospirae bacterium YQR-1]
MSGLQAQGKPKGCSNGSKVGNVLVWFQKVPVRLPAAMSGGKVVVNRCLKGGSL